MEFNIDARTLTVHMKLSFYEFDDLKRLKENLWFELMKRWFEFTGGRPRKEGKIKNVKSNSDN